MLRNLRRFFEQNLLAAKSGGADSHEPSIERAYRLATATLLVEMMRADFEVSRPERDALSRALTTAFDLGEEETAALIRDAEAAADEAVSLHDFTSLINQHLSPDQKYRVIELLWEVAFADGEIDKYEDHLVRKVADLIYVRHRQFIRAKHDAMEARARKGLNPPG